MKKILEKHETMVCILLIVLYVVVNSYCLQNFGTTDYRSVIINTAFSAGLVLLMIFTKSTQYYGLTRVRQWRKYLYFVPLLLIMTVNFWRGISVSNSGAERLFHILTMVNIGFLEEIIFRGFLFRMMEKDNLKRAMIVSALTFGIGHVVNLLNGADLIPTLLQICYAASLGYLFVVIFHKSKSIVPCIITHIVINASSIFAVENKSLSFISSAFLIVVPLVYVIYLNKNVKPMN